MKLMHWSSVFYRDRLCLRWVPNRSSLERAIEQENEIRVRIADGPRGIVSTGLPCVFGFN